jgi:hypothetical protein
MPHGSVRISHEVGQRFSNDELLIITQLIQDYDTFGPDELHHTGIIEHEGVQLVWQIDGQNAVCEVLPQKAYNKETSRGILMIMLCSEAQ